MIIRKALVLDANILIRAVLGRRVRGILKKYYETAKFDSPETCFEEAAEHLPVIVGDAGAERLLFWKCWTEYGISWNLLIRVYMGDLKYLAGGE